MAKKYLVHKHCHPLKDARKVQQVLLKHGYLSVGFSAFSLADASKYNDNFYALALTDNRKEFNTACDNVFQKERWYTGHKRGCLWRFLRLSRGDIVVVPQGKTFSIYEVLDNPLKISEFVAPKLNNNNAHLRMNKGLLYCSAYVELAEKGEVI